jgi:hypothetical protein
MHPLRSLPPLPPSAEERKLPMSPEERDSGQRWQQPKNLPKPVWKLSPLESPSKINPKAILIKSIIIEGYGQENGLKKGVDYAWKQVLKKYTEDRNNALTGNEKLYLAREKDAKIVSAFASLKNRWVEEMKLSASEGSSILVLQTVYEKIKAERNDLAVLATAPKYSTINSVIDGKEKGFLNILENFINQSILYRDEMVEFYRFDAFFQTADVLKVLRTISDKYKANLTIADLKALCAQESGDFTTISIAGLEGKKKGEKRTITRSGKYVGVGQLDEDAKNNAIKWAKENCSIDILINPDPRRSVETCILLTATCLGHKCEHLFNKLTNSVSIDAHNKAIDIANAKSKTKSKHHKVFQINATELKKMTLAAYNGGQSTVTRAVEATDKISWLDIQSNTNITAEQRGYVAKILFRTGQ